MRSGVRITYAGVRKSYPGSRRQPPILAIESVDLQVDPDEFVAVIGTSGCGKSTLLKLTAGLILPDEGSITFDDQPVDGPMAQAGMVFQVPALLQWRSVLRNVLFPLDVQGSRAADSEQRARELLDVVGLAGFEDRWPSELSGGMQQRVALARAMIHDPGVLLMDEPFGALDALTREHLNLELMRIWTRRPKTVVLITHDIAEAVFLADRVAVMSSRPGRIHKIVDVGLPRPRDWEVRYSTEFTDYCRELESLIPRHAMDDRTSASPASPALPGRAEAGSGA